MLCLHQLFQCIYLAEKIDYCVKAKICIGVQLDAFSTWFGFYGKFDLTQERLLHEVLEIVMLMCITILSC